MPKLSHSLLPAALGGLLLLPIYRWGNDLFQLTLQICRSWCSFHHSANHCQLLHSFRGSLPQRVLSPRHPQRTSLRTLRPGFGSTGSPHQLFIYSSVSAHSAYKTSRQVAMLTEETRRSFLAVFISGQVLFAGACTTPEDWIPVFKWRKMQCVNEVPLPPPLPRSQGLI